MQNMKHKLLNIIIITTILLNNGCHESVGGQPTIASNINIKKFSNSLGYKNTQTHMISLIQTFL